MLRVHFVHFVLHKSFYLISARCDSTFCVTAAHVVYIEDKSVENYKAPWIRFNGEVSIHDKGAQLQNFATNHHPHVLNFLSQLSS